MEAYQSSGPWRKCQGMLMEAKGKGKGRGRVGKEQKKRREKKKKAEGESIIHTRRTHTARGTLVFFFHQQSPFRIVLPTKSCRSGTLSVCSALSFSPPPSLPFPSLHFIAFNPVAINHPFHPPALSIRNQATHHASLP